MSDIESNQLTPSETYVVETLSRSIAPHSDDKSATKNVIATGFRVTTCRPLVLTQVVGVSHPEKIFIVPEQGELHVYGDFIRIVGSIKNRGGKLKIFCRRLEVVGIGGEEIKIDVSGISANNHPPLVAKQYAITKPGKTQNFKIASERKPALGMQTSNAASVSEWSGDNGADGEDGYPGGSIILQATEIFVNASQLKLCANGGAGGNGQNGSNGQHGADGYDGVSKEQSDYGVNAASWDIHGSAGGNGGHGGKGGNGGDGGNGGIVGVEVVQLVGNVLINASGGYGADGGAAGNGGNGGDGGIGANPTIYTPSRGNTQFVNQGNGGNAGSGGNAGMPGDDGNDGNDGLISTIVYDAHTAVGDDKLSIKTFSLGNKKHEEGVVAATPGCTGQPGRGGKADHRDWPSQGLLVLNFSIGPGKAGKPGIDGISPTKQVKKVKKSLPQKPTIQFETGGDTALLAISQPPLIVANSSERVSEILGLLGMMLEHGRLVHLMTDISNGSDELRALFQWIAKLSAAFVNVKVLMPNEYSRAVALKILAEASLDRVFLKQDYFGNSYVQAPLYSIDKLHETLTESLANYEKIDAYQQNLSQQLKDAIKESGDLQALRSAHNDEVKALEKQRIKLLSELKNISDKLIPKAEIKRSTCQRLLLEKLSDLRKDFEQVFFNIKLEQIPLALGQLAFAETPYMKMFLGMASGGELVSNMRDWVGQGMESDDGVVYDHTLLAASVNHVQRGLNSVSLESGFKAGIDGEIKLNDPNGYRLETTRQDLDDLCEKFYNTSTSARKTKAALDDYISAVADRNEQVAHYNLCMHSLTEVVNLKKQAHTEIEKIDEENINNNPFLGCIAAGVSRRRRNSLATIVSELYSAGRSLMFWQLEKVDAFANIDIGEGFATLSVDKLEAIMIDLLSRMLTIGDTPYKYKPSWSKEWELNTNHGVLIVLDKEDDDYERFFTSLLSGNLATVTVTCPLSLESNSMDPFNQMPACRVLELRVWLDVDCGKDSRPIQVQFNITHNGEETFLRNDEQPFTLSHEQITDRFAYEEELIGGNENQLSNRKIKEYWGPWRKQAETLGTTVPIGPFTDWHIKLDKEYNEDLLTRVQIGGDLNVKSLTLEFRCIYRTG